MMTARTLLLASLTLTCTAGNVACRSHADLRTQYTQMRPQMLRGEWEAAAKQLEASKEKAYEEEDRVMYWLNLGTLYHYAGDIPASNENFVRAEEEMQKLWTTSISSEATKFIVSESVQDYQGEEFEKILLYYYTALNAVRNGRIDDALVEARRADEFLKKMQVHYEKEAGEDGKAVGLLYKQDAFILWMVGMFYEMEGSHADAHLAYKAALRSYRDEYARKFGTPAPSFLKEDVVRSAYLAGLADDAERLKQQLGVAGDTIEKLNAGMAQVTVFHGTGEAPFKKDMFINGPMPDGYIMRIAIPKFEAVPFRVARATVNVAGQSVATQMAEPITTIALRNFEHRLPTIKARAIARAVVKYVATKGTSKAVSGGSDSSSERKIAGALIGLLGNVASAASEHADLRGWTTLPAAIGIARMWVPAGQQEVTVSFDGGTSKSITIPLNPGDRKIISVRTME